MEDLFFSLFDQSNESWVFNEYDGSFNEYDRT